MKVGIGRCWGWCLEFALVRCNYKESKSWDIWWTEPRVEPSAKYRSGELWFERVVAEVLW